MTNRERSKSLADFRHATADIGASVSLADVGRQYRPNRRPEKKKPYPVFTEERLNRIWDTISPADQQRIKDEAKAAAEEAMAAFRVRTGK